MMEELVTSLSDRSLANYIERYEDGRVQSWPRLRFVDDAGCACPAAALAGAETSAEFMDGAAGRDFRGSPLERVSRSFEDGNLDAGALYRDCLLERARRSVGSAPTARRTTSRGRPLKA